EYLDLESHLYAPTSSATGCFGFHDVPNAFRDAQRPMERATIQKIRPALRRAVDRDGNHAEIRSAALTALQCLDRNRNLPRARDEPYQTAPRVETDRTRARRTITLARDAQPIHAVWFLRVVRDESAGVLTRRAALAAIGAGAERASPEYRKDAVLALHRIATHESTDADFRNLALLSLGAIGTQAAHEILLQIARTDLASQQTFAALALATSIWRARKQAPGTPVNPQLKQAVTRRLQQLSQATRDWERAAAFRIARALVADKSVVGECLSVLESSLNPRERRHACISLGLVGEASKSVLGTLRRVHATDPFRATRRDAVIALVMLRDQRIAGHVIRQLTRATTFDDQSERVALLGWVGDHTAVDPLIEILDDPARPAALRAEAAITLGRLADLRRTSPIGRLSPIWVPGVEPDAIDTALAQRR
ncbi:MAG: HEAT repeat domain-containing protein, partial [Planctomycetota bacterium]